MSVAIGGYLLMAILGGSPATIDMAVKTGTLVKAFDSAEDCEAEKTKINPQDGRVLLCVPALAVINR